MVADTIPVLLGLYFPQYPLLADRQLVTILVSIFIVSSMYIQVVGYSIKQFKIDFPSQPV